MAYNVLIVDDSPSMRKIMVKSLKMSSFPINELYEAGNGKEALDICDDEWVDVIITDLNMPEMDGIELLEHIHQDDLLQHVPTVVVSTEGRPAVIDHIRKLGVVEYISKPFQPELIAETLERLMGFSHEATENRNSETLDF